MKSCASRALLVGLMATGSAWAGGVPGSGPSYHIQIRSLTLADVRIELPQAPSEFYMSTAATGREDGFASYVRDLSLHCGSQPLGAERHGAVWRIDKTGDQPCTATYSVDLGFSLEKWAVGNEQAGFSDGKGTFVASKALFLESSLSGVRRVAFQVPAGWSLITPWSKSAEGEFEFGRDEELGDLISFGQLSSGSTVSGALRVQLVTFGALSAQQQEVLAVVEKVASHYNSLFPDSKPASYLVALIPGEEADGEAYAHGFASTMKAPLKVSERIVWADVIAHEMFHYWNGRQLRAAVKDGELEWFNEGFTEYFANLALMRTGQISQEDFLHKVAANIGQYEYFLASGLFNGVPIRKAGEKKGRNRFGVYASGWVIAFVLDQEIRRNSGEQKSLIDLMRRLLEDPEKGKLTVTIVLKAVQEIAGLETRSLIDNGISERVSLDPERYLADMGFDVAGQSYQDEYYVHVSARVSAEQKRLRLAWAGF
jgi:predicted metalloprotease with PDZ domain